MLFQIWNWIWISLMKTQIKQKNRWQTYITFILVRRTNITLEMASSLFHKHTSFIHEQLRSVIHINFSWERDLAKCNSRFVTRCSSFWSSRTSDPALSHLPCWRTYSLHARSMWQTYICLLLFVWSFGWPSPFANPCGLLSYRQLLLNLLHVLRYSQT